MPPPAKILIVDDDTELRQLLGEELRDLGHESFFASDGLQAITLARRHRPDLIVLDLLLPGGDGFTVLERRRDLSAIACIPVIVFSGVRSAEAEQRALNLGAREFVAKSIESSDLIEAISRVLKHEETPKGIPADIAYQLGRPAEASPQVAAGPPPAVKLRIAPNLRD